MADTAGFDAQLGDKDLRKLETMKANYPRISMFAVLSRLLVYFSLPMLIAISTFDRARDILAKPNIAQSANDIFSKIFERIVMFSFLFCLSNYLCCAPYLLWFYSANGYEVVLLIILAICLPILWIMILTQCDYTISKLKTYSTNDFLMNK